MSTASTYDVPDDATDVSGGLEEAVRVFVRIRPLNKRELAEKQTIGWNFNESSMLEDTPNGQRVYAFDHCFGPDSTNQETYDIVGKPVVLKAMEGYNGTVFTYGQTGSGKTWTMRGSESDPGMMVLCIRDILEWIKAHPDITYSIRIAYLEVYNEEINDLLGEQGPSSKNLKIISEDAARGAVIGGLVEEKAVSSEDFMAILQRGEASRSYASTNMNAESSRSHTIYRVSIDAKEKGDPAEESTSGASGGRTSYLNLVDLAGSERQKSTKAEGKVLKEGANINKSLLALGAVINKLGEFSKKSSSKSAKQLFIPYRDSKLTRILKQSLGGNTLTSILCAVTPAPMHREETVSTLKFGQLCKSIKNTVKANDGLLDDKALLKQYRATIAELRAQVEDLSGGKGSLAFANLDPDSFLGVLKQQKAELEIRTKTLENMLISKGVSPTEISTQIEGNMRDFGGSFGSSGISDEKVAELNKQIATLTQENFDLLQSKASSEEDEQRLLEIAFETDKLNEEKLKLQNERFKLLSDSRNLDEKEAKIGTLITNLDDKESKLRQKLSTLKEQVEQWNRSITDFKRREDLVEEWQRNHKVLEDKVEELKAQVERKGVELSEREKKIAEEENRARQANKELAEREQRLQLGLSRIAKGEESNHLKEESLQSFEAALKRKETECDIRERELASRRKELESWDLLLREKDRKIATEQKSLDDRELSISTTEERLKSREIENERKHLEIKQKEIQLGETAQKYEKLVSEVEEKEKDLKEKDREYQSLRKELGNREEELRKWEKQLMKLQEQMKGIESREKTLRLAEDNFKRKEDEFYNVKVAQITARHAKELRHLEDVIQKQLKIASDFQRDLEGTRTELAAKQQENHELEMTVSQRDSLIAQMREQITRLETNTNTNNGINTGINGQSPSQQFQGSDLQPPQQQQQQTTNLSALFNSQSDSDPFANNKPAQQQQQQKSTFILQDNQLSTEQFITQLAVTRRLIYQVLERYDALPDSKTSTLLRRNHPVKVIVAAPPPPPPMGYSGYYNPGNDYNGYDSNSNSPVPPPPPHLMSDESAVGAQAEYKQQPPPQSLTKNNRPGVSNRTTSNDTLTSNSVQQFLAIAAAPPPPAHRVNSMTAANMTSIARASSTASMASQQQTLSSGMFKQQSLSRMNSSSVAGIKTIASTRSMLSSQQQHQTSQHQLRAAGSMTVIAEEKEMMIRAKDVHNAAASLSSSPSPPAPAPSTQNFNNASFSSLRSPAAEKGLPASASSPTVGGTRGSVLVSPSNAKSPSTAAAPVTTNKRAGGLSTLMQQSASSSALSPLSNFVKMSESSDGVPVATVDITMKSGFKHAVREMNAAAAAKSSGNSPFKK